MWRSNTMLSGNAVMRFINVSEMTVFEFRAFFQTHTKPNFHFKYLWNPYFKNIYACNAIQRIWAKLKMCWMKWKLYRPKWRESFLDASRFNVALIFQTNTLNVALNFQVNIKTVLTQLQAQRWLKATWALCTLWLCCRPPGLGSEQIEGMYCSF